MAMITHEAFDGFRRLASLLAPVVLAATTLAGCGVSKSPSSMPGDADDARPFAAIAADDTVRFVGTEPFWGGRVAGTMLTYETPENPGGAQIAVKRFAGRGGVSWTGEFAGQRFALMVTEGRCSDGMSDREYPFVATLQVSGQNRAGCAWIEGKMAAQNRP